jgi:hypothetical protein
MKRLVIILSLIAMSCVPNQQSGVKATQHSVPEPVTLVWPSGLPVYDHVVIVIEENKSYNEIIGNSAAPYINNVLKKEGANFTRIFGEEHDSEGNYFWLFSGDNQTIGFEDDIPSKKNNHNYPFTSPNLGQHLISKGLSFKGYSEDLPYIGFAGAKQGFYARKHVPWISFANLPNGQTSSTSANIRFADFPTGPSQYDILPTVAFVIPNQINDMHNGSIDKSIPAGDRWLKKNIDPYFQWAKTHNSLLILTFDENHNKRRYKGLTNPLVDPQTCLGRGRDHEYCVDLQNRIVTIFVGAHIKPGDYPEGKGITHVNILRTLEAMYGLPKAGFQQPNAAGAGINDDYIITDVFETEK